MTTDFAIQYAAMLMQQMEINTYSLQYVQIVVKPLERLRIDAANRIYLLTDGFSDLIRITSNSGIYDITDIGITQCKHEHTVSIEIENRSALLRHVGFIMVIPQ